MKDSTLEPNSSAQMEHGIVAPFNSVQQPQGTYNYFLGADMNHLQSRLMSRRDAATYLGVTEQTLAIWKCTGRYSLPCVKIGHLVKYRQSDLDAFITKNLKSAPLVN